MKNKLFIRGIAPLTVCAVLLPTVASAQTTSFTATGWVNQVLAPGILCTNALGQVLLRGTVHTERIQASDARVTGQLLSLGDASYNADGTANWQGTAYLQVGTWDAAGTNFTPTGGLWEGTWAGVMQTNYDLQLSMAGYGSGGSIDGWRLAEMLIRTNASAPTDTNAPYFYSGTIKPPPVSTNLYFDDFDNGVYINSGHGWDLHYYYGSCRLYGTNQQLYLSGDWRGVSGLPPSVINYFCMARLTSHTWSLADGQTLECQADLIRISENTTNIAILWVGSDEGFYGFHLSQTGVGLSKWPTATGDFSSDMTFFWWDNTVHVPRTNVVLYLALTRDKRNLIITTRLLDKANQNAVFFERSFVDTPGVDASLTIAQYTNLTGITSVPVGRDKGAPIFRCSTTAAGVDLFQFTDGTQPPVEAIWDNFLLRLHDEPPVSIARAVVEITFPVPAGEIYILEAAPSIQGPWMRVQELEMPGIQKRTIPVSGTAQFFRVVEAP